MHIVMLSEDYLPNIGGVATHVYYLSQNLVKRGHTVTIITKNNKSYKKYVTEVYDNLTIIRIPIGKLRKIDNVLYSLRASTYINNMARTEKIDILHWHTLNKDSRVIKYLNKEYPIVYTNHLSWFRSLYYQGKQKKIKNLISHTDGIICPSKETKEITTKIFPNLKCKQIANGVLMPSNLSIKEKDILKQTLNINSQQPILISTNRFEPVKNLKMLINILPKLMSEINNLIVIFIGDGSELPYLKLQLKESTNEDQYNRIKFLGRLPVEKVGKYLSISDVFVNTSLTEGMSISLLEAMSFGVIPVVTDVGGNRDVIKDHNNGVLVETKNETMLYNNLLDILNNLDNNDYLRTNAKTTIFNSFLWPNIADKVINFYNEVINE
ncbi:glycosyltransferase family 4 protein [Enterococcus hirae]|uniref:Glycosyltransferase family 1 protein n=5 Tax=Enterococcus faecium TaxID=1352 RepID=A0AB73N7B2_ENTFC|nr:glycosyltransferase family 4 protein [Enterococcus faecium]EME7167529.1 glycosyltransferase family 4 protein [Enterococcus faecium]EME8119934.1 glycosyltransferase family 4 protein [Enterococcus faecium]EME8275030.1 glycosyltransferase family 4 protein [Enterococcus faecium]OTN94421.1 hypothetical protein A5804_002731 [Enterococcus faecium]